jgi:hypothetical protein
VQALAAELATTYDEHQVIDADRITCRGSAPGMRLLSTWRDGERALTAEHLLVQGDTRLHVLTGVMAAERYAEHGAAVRAAMRTFRHDRQQSFADADSSVAPAGARSRPSAVVELEVLCGPHPGTVRAVLEGPGAAVQLPDAQSGRLVSRSLLPGWLAALVGLGPRPAVAVPGVLVVDAASLDLLLGADAGGPDAVAAAFGDEPVPPAWGDALGALPARVAARWRLTTRVADHDGALVPAGAIDVVDAGEAGLWQLAPVDTEWLTAELAGEPGPPVVVAVSTLSTTAVWELFTGL